MKIIPLLYLDRKKYPHIAKEFPRAKYMTLGGDKYSSLSLAKKRTTEKMVKRGYAKPEFEVIK